MLRAGVRQSRVSTRGRSERSPSSPRRSRPTRRCASATASRTRSAPGALAHYHGEVGSAFADGSAVCWSGYYHGILERAFAGVSEEDLPAVSRRLCASAPVRRSDFIAYQCVHGLGHGLMIYTGYDMPLSLATCDELVTSWDQTSCTGGVFMENLQTSYGTLSQWLRDGRPALPVPHRGRAAQALLLPDGHVAHPRRRRRRLGEDRRVVQQGRAWAGWPRASSRSAGTPPAGRSRTLPRSSASARWRGDDGGPVRLRRGARHHEHGRRCAPLVGVLLRGQRAAAGRTASTGSARSSAASRGKSGATAGQPAAAPCRSSTGTSASPARAPRAEALDARNDVEPAVDPRRVLVVSAADDVPPAVSRDDRCRRHLRLRARPVQPRR